MQELAVVHALLRLITTAIIPWLGGLELDLFQASSKVLKGNGIQGLSLSTRELIHAKFSQVGPGLLTLVNDAFKASVSSTGQVRLTPGQRSRGLEFLDTFKQTLGVLEKLNVNDTLRN